MIMAKKNTNRMNGAEAYDTAFAGVTGETGAGMMNRSGTSTSPEDALDVIREAQRTPPSPKGDARQLAEYRKPYLEQRIPIGSRPVAIDQARTGRAEEGNTSVSLLLDKLGERLAFERQGVRLYESLIGKIKAIGEEPGGPAIDELEHILDEERAHFRFLSEAIVGIGGDPTVQTPCANIAGILSQGLVQVVADPRTTVPQCLEAILNAELADNDGWNLLQALVATLGVGDLGDRIEEAKEHEQDHLEMVRSWQAAMVMGNAAPIKPNPEGKQGRSQRVSTKSASKPPSRTVAGSSRSGPAKTGTRSKAKEQVEVKGKVASRPLARKTGRK
ncbi:MAG: hypothetical protein JWP91_570 [Fibrobacteres bacterium]|nr:hypothetical protein [Fibrobacterota bacterium]